MWWFLPGVAVGVLVTVPWIVFASRRTARRVSRLEQRARAAERLAELGTMTRGLAHEIKNPLSTIGLNLQLLRERLGDLPEDQADSATARIDSVIEETERLRGILQDFLSFAGRVQLSPQPLDLTDVIEQVIDFYRPQAAASGIELRSELDPNTGEVLLDPTLFKQALLNLLINATQAMVAARYHNQTHGGASTLTIRTRPLRDEVDIHVVDNGPGIDDETRSQMFQPYFSTRRGGTGLGLPTARRILEEHGGYIDVSAELGKGSDFVVHLPREGPSKAEEPTAAAAAS